MDEFLMPEEVAERLKVKVTTVREWIRQGSLRAAKLGRFWRVRSADFDAFIEGGMNVDEGKEIAARRAIREAMRRPRKRG